MPHDLNPQNPVQLVPHKILIAVISCHNFDAYDSPNRAKGQVNVRTAVVRETWLNTVKRERPDIDVKFFYGRGGHRLPESDEVFLDCDDSYDGLPHKIKAVVRWVLNRGYDLLVKCDDDTFISTQTLSTLGMSEEHFCGQPSAVQNLQRHKGYCSITTNFATVDKTWPDVYAIGGMYSLSKKSMQIVSAGKIMPMTMHTLDGRTVSLIAEDKWVSHILRLNHIKVTFTPEYSGYTDDSNVRESVLQEYLTYARKRFGLGVEPCMTQCKGVDTLIFDSVGVSSLPANEYFEELLTVSYLSFCPHFNCTSSRMRALYTTECLDKP